MYKIYDIRKDFLATVRTKDEVDNLFPDYLYTRYSEVEISEDPMAELPEPSILDVAPIVSVGNPIDGCINVDTLEDLTQEVIDAFNLGKTKEAKTLEVKGGFVNYYAQPVVIGDNEFYCSDQALIEYKELYELGLSLGLTEGQALSKNNGWVQITKAEIEQVIQEIGLRKVKARKKLGYYLQAIGVATTIAEVDVVVWEDVREGE